MINYPSRFHVFVRCSSSFVLRSPEKGVAYTDKEVSPDLKLILLDPTQIKTHHRNGANIFPMTNWSANIQISHYNAFKLSLDDVDFTSGGILVVVWARASGDGSVACLFDVLVE